MPLNQRDFINHAMWHLGITPTQLGRALDKDNAYNTVNSWRTDKPKSFRKLSYEDTMAILELCGWLNMDADVFSTSERPDDPLATLAEAVAELAHDQALILDALDVPQTGRAPIEARSKLPPVFAKKTVEKGSG